MKLTLRSVVIGGAVTATAALFAAPAAASPARQNAEHAVFVQTDNLAGNTVVAYHREGDGSLVQAGVYATGGLGGQLTGSVVDHTASQGALAYDPAAHLLYAVNAGSDSITVFAVRGDRLEHLDTVGSGGRFPVSVTVHRGVVYVLNARGGGSIQGFARIGDRLVLVPAWHRELGFDPAASPEFTSTPGQVAFTPDGSRLLVTTKGDGQSIEVFGLGRSGPALEPVITPDPGNVPFGIAFDRHGRVLVVEAAPSAVATFGLQPDGTLALEGRVTTGQAAACWITVSHKLVYVSNAGSATVSGFTDHRGVLTSLGRTPTDPGTVDSAATPDGRYLYVQGGAKGTVDGFAIGRDGSLTALGAVSVPDGAGGEGIVAS